MPNARKTAREVGSTQETDSPIGVPPTFVDAFAGCGGLSLGLKRAGWRGLFAIEKDAFAFETLQANYGPGGRHRYDWPASIERRAWDIHHLLRDRRPELAELAGAVDLLAGGPPCQGFSQAGRRRADDPRNALFSDYLSLVEILRPRLVLIENVRGFQMSFAAGSGGAENFAETLRRRLGVDYETSSAVLRACDYGVPQARHRFFLVGVLRGAGRDVADFFPSLDPSRSGFLASRGLSRSPTARDAISDLELARNGSVASAESRGFQSMGYCGPRTPFQRHMRNGHQGVPTDLRLARHSPEISQRFAEIIRACGEEGRLNTTISAEIRQAHGGLKKKAIRVLDPLRPAPTVTSLPDDLLHYSEARTLTVRENARLQTFPDWYVFRGSYTTGGDRRRNQVPRFTQVANAVPPLLAEQIGFALRRLIPLRQGHPGVLAKQEADLVQGAAVRRQPDPEVVHPTVIDDHGLTASLRGP